MKRYAIVRVDNTWCPNKFENISNDFVCSYKKSKTLNNLSTNCANCRYGDTKEQLVRKVAQALERTITDGVYVRFGIPITVEKLATKIVEFLGVE